tara:strand:- start:1288 stop:1620 length:333 start_codon:yes stop_codon:yes gene_type:complete
MAHYEMYVCLNKATYESQIPTALQNKLGWDDGDGNSYRPTWKEVSFSGKLGVPRFSNNGNYVIVKGEFSMKEGELTAIANLGNGLSYPNNTILTKTEAQTLVSSNVFTGE